MKILEIGQVQSDEDYGRMLAEALAELRLGRPVELLDRGTGSFATRVRLVPVGKAKVRVEAWTVWPPPGQFKRDIQDVIEIFGRVPDYDDELFLAALPDNKHGGHGVALYSLVGMPRTVRGLDRVLVESDAAADVDPANTQALEDLVQRLSRGREGGPGSKTWDPFGWRKGRAADNPDEAP